MKKYYNLSLMYAIIGLIGGVFYREFTKFNSFVGVTSLKAVHPHALVLGTIFFILMILLEKNFHLNESKKIKPFLAFYNSGLIVTIIMFLVRGTNQVLQTELSKGFNAAISGIAGVGHILLAIGIVYFFMILKEKITQ